MISPTKRTHSMSNFIELFKAAGKISFGNKSFVFTLLPKVLCFHCKAKVAGLFFQPPSFPILSDHVGGAGGVTLVIR